MFKFEFICIVVKKKLKKKISCVFVYVCVILFKEYVQIIIPNFICPLHF